jgi:hypothetical protein
MTNSQRTQNPDDGNGNSNDVERRRDDRDVIPVPPDSNPGAPVEEPPDTEGAPVGDVDDSPKRIA